jgi:ribonuclease BN (tRNA processing enzyme)
MFANFHRLFLAAFVVFHFAVAQSTLAHDRDALAAGKIAVGAIDQRALDKPARNTIFSCNRQTMGPALDRPWVDGAGVIDLAKKPTIDGAIKWDSQLTIAPREQSRDVTGNGLPNHPTGFFPVARDSAAYRFDRNPNSIQAYRLQFNIPTMPQITATPGCLPMGTIGVALSGGVFFNALDAPGRDAVVNEIFDQCEGHPERNGRYHYHHYSPCFDHGDPNQHSPLIGYALDGFGIYGPRGEDGKYVANDQLDECHGHVGAVAGPNGGAIETYHYHANREFPYTLGCFRGVVAMMPPRPGARPRAAGETPVPLALATSEPAVSVQLTAAAPRPAPRQRTEASRENAQLKVITLGTGGPPHDPDRAGPSALIQYGNARFLVDMGRDTQLRLQRANIPLGHLSALLFTHHHLDHNEEFVPILLKARLQGGAGEIIGPPGTQDYTDFVLRYYKEDSDYRARRTGRSGDALREVAVREVSGGDSFDLAGVAVKTARVNHTIHTVAYRFDAGGKSIVISGDLSFSQSLIELARGADVLVIDSGQLGPAGQQPRAKTPPANEPRAHATIAEVAAMARDAQAKRLVLTHFASPKFDENSVRARVSEIFPGEIIFAKDLLEIAP